jgi:hypothetical protein
MGKNNLLELFLFLIFIVVVLYYNNTVNKNKKGNKNIMSPVYSRRINIVGILFLIFILIEIIKRFFK